MRLLLITAVCLHVLPAIGWAGMTFALARTGAADVERTFRPQMAAGGFAILAGGVLWSLTQGHAFGPVEQVLAAGALAAVMALAIQAASAGPVLTRLAEQPSLRVRAALGQRISALLIGLAVVCMVSARYV